MKIEAFPSLQLTLHSSLCTLNSSLLRGVAQLGDVSERSRCEIKRGIRSGSDLLTGKCNAARSLVTTGSALGKREKLISGVWLSLVERLVRDQEVGCSNHLTPTITSRWEKAPILKLSQITDTALHSMQTIPLLDTRIS